MKEEKEKLLELIKNTDEETKKNYIDYLNKESSIDKLKELYTILLDIKKNKDEPDDLYNLMNNKNKKPLN